MSGLVSVSFRTVEGNWTDNDPNALSKKNKRPYLAVELAGLSDVQFDEVAEILQSMELRHGGIETGHTDFVGFGVDIRRSLRKKMAIEMGGGEEAERPPSVSFKKGDTAREFLSELEKAGIIEVTPVMRLDLDSAIEQYHSQLHPEHPR